MTTERINPLTLRKNKIESQTVTAAASSVMVQAIVGGLEGQDIPVQVDPANRVCLPLMK